MNKIKVNKFSAISCSLLIMFVLITTCSVIAIKYKANQKLLSVKQRYEIFKTKLKCVNLSSKNIKSKL